MLKGDEFCEKKLEQVSWRGRKGNEEYKGKELWIVAILKRVVKAGLIENVTPKRRLGAGEGISHADI